jgi:hypothetical protein
MTALLSTIVLLLAALVVATRRAQYRLQAAVDRLQAALVERTTAATTRRDRAAAPLRHLQPLALQLVRELEPLATWPPELPAVPAPFLLVEDDLRRLTEAAAPCGPDLRLHATVLMDSLAHVLALMGGPLIPSELQPPTFDPRQLLALRIHGQYAHRDAVSLLSALERAEGALGYAAAG